MVSTPPTLSGILPDDWSEVYSTVIPARKGETVPTNDLGLAAPVAAYLHDKFPHGIYRHQHEAIRRLNNGHDVCLATSTASGKTLAFTTAAFEMLATRPDARILAIYPQRALGNEQEKRWREAVAAAGLNVGVCRIDGSVSTATRPELLRNSRIAVLTPDVMHAWLLSRLNDRAVRAFVGGLAMVVVDEVHTYTGVVGSNAGYLFRRLTHCASMLGASPRFFCASATIRDPERHLEALFGRPFSLIGPELDTSPRHAVDVHLVRRPGGADSLTEIAGYLGHLVKHTSRRFLAFVDSRKQTEHIATISGRQIAGASPQDEEHDGSDVSEDLLGTATILESASVLPYRAGYEERDRQTIQTRLAAGSLRGVVSTSALELGIDIPHLDTGILIGVPRSSTSLYQRIGRVGRAGPGAVIVISTGDVYDEAVFRAPDQLLHRPPAEGALYLENPRIQYIHALCLARNGGEHDMVARSQADDNTFTSPVAWPAGFLDLCVQERTGQIGSELQAMKSEAGDSPNYAFPLRDVEAQFQIEVVQGPNRQAMGSISYGQALRETYPGAIYFYATVPYRVTSVSTSNRRIAVRRDRYYTTRPNQLPTLVFPNLSPGNVHEGFAFDDNFKALECNLQIRESVAGLKERRGSREQNYPYPLTGDPVRFDGQRFTRNYFTTGALLFHPLLDRNLPDAEVLAAMIFEALLIVAPYERQDVGFAVDKLRTDAGPLSQGTRFVAVFDQTYGSLRLSGRLMQLPVLRSVLETALELAQNTADVSSGTIEAAEALLDAARSTPTPAVLVETTSLPEGMDDRPRVVMPGSVGLNVTRGNAEFGVDRVIFNPRMGGLAYVGHHLSARAVEGQTETIRFDALAPIPGESVIGIYDYDTGDVVPV